ncbi:hypothetical protein K2173_005239 [Erythroxylum novogranatense]|uniref:SAM-dependent MTase RsmB/NOP-type domain-containing protein n=1 Tax=Erythroxylum novogranatense TaxID=1862640 RepID=A0AAV8TT20_9ROSI|nr:hypothetical protein K2173_005239 [Erythroxylum novogranatense]
MGGGRGQRSRTQRKHFRDGRENVWKRSKSDNSSSAVDNPPWQPFATQNPAFDEYYKEQGIVAIEEWDSFVQFLRTPLPSAFRINSSSQFSEDIKLQLENDFMKSLQAEDADGSEVEAIRPLPWYPDNLAWQSNFSLMQLRKNQTLEKFHEFLKLENEIGNITRQEAVSMVPPHFLDVRPDHFVLDMCAAPGWKTFQLLEIIYQSMESGSLPDGMVVANDLDVQRCNLLIHQTKRMCTANLIVTNNEAQHFPGCRANKTNFRASDRENSGMGNGLHNLQVQIAMRGISLVKVGGRMVYSTSSMNPVENEALVAEILRKCGGSVELVDVSSSLPQLVRRPGLKKWKVRDKGVWLTSYKDVVKSYSSGVLPSMFPSGQSYEAPNDNNHKVDNGSCMNSEGSQMREDSVTDNVSEEVSDLPLERCMRIVPHDQNSGAFFIAVLCKLSTLPAIPEKPPRHGQRFIKRDEAREKPLDEVIEDSKELELNSEDSAVENFSEAASEADMIENDPSNSTLQPLPANEKTEAGKPGVKRKLQIQGRWNGVDPVILFQDQDIIDTIKTFYGIDESFPFNGHLISRNSDNNHVKRVYYISKSVEDVLELNILAGQQLKISSVGLKMFERQTSREGNTAPCSFRISSEGLPVILPHIRKQILYSSAVDFKNLLQYKAVKFADFVDSEFGEKASKLQMGCCVIVLRGTPVKVDASTVAIGCWKGRSSPSVMVMAIDCQELLERLRLRTETENHSPMQENIFVEPDGMQNMDKIDELQESKLTEVAADG